MKLSILLLLAILIACTPSSNEPLVSTREDYSFSMNVKIVNPNLIKSTCENLGVVYEANGCTSFDLDKKICTIYVMPQRYAHDTERLSIIGHEVWHCVYGRWHN